MAGIRIALQLGFETTPPQPRCLTVSGRVVRRHGGSRLHVVIVGADRRLFRRECRPRSARQLQRVGWVLPRRNVIPDLGPIPGSAARTPTSSAGPNDALGVLEWDIRHAPSDFVPMLASAARDVSYIGPQGRPREVARRSSIRSREPSALCRAWKKPVLKVKARLRNRGRRRHRGPVTASSRRTLFT